MHRRCFTYFLICDTVYLTWHCIDLQEILCLYNELEQNLCLKPVIVVIIKTAPT